LEGKSGRHLWGVTIRDKEGFHEALKIEYRRGGLRDTNASQVSAQTLDAEGPMHHDEA
jgi:hypothetical protein